MRVVETARIGAFSWSLHFDEADQRIRDRGGVIRASLEVLHRSFADEVDRPGGQAGGFGQVADERFEWPAQLILW